MTSSALTRRFFRLTSAARLEALMSDAADIDPVWHAFRYSLEGGMGEGVNRGRKQPLWIQKTAVRVS